MVPSSVDTERWDVIVCGAGMAGLCGGLAALEAGAHVLLVEKGTEPGGSMRMSGGGVWTSQSMDTANRWAPEGDPERKRLLVEGLAGGLAWLKSHGVRPLSEFNSDIRLPLQRGMEVDPKALTRTLAAAISTKGGQLAVETSLERLVRADSGAIDGVVLRGVSGRRTVRGRSVLLTTGGFQGNKALLATYVSKNADRLLLRSNPRSVGDGLLAALEIGARTSPNMSTFYGHTMPGRPADPPPERWLDVTAYYTQDAVLVNEHGERFFDESSSMADERAPAHVVNQPNGRAFLVLDDRVYRGEGGPQQSPSAVRPSFDNAVASGAPTAIADTLEDLADAMAKWGVSPRGFLATIREFNEAISAGRGGELRIARCDNLLPVTTPPLRALEVRGGITFTMGGVDVDASLRVLDRDGSEIPGLYAAGADAGGTYQGGYMGGLVLGLVHGRLAGTAAARYATSG